MVILPLGQIGGFTTCSGWTEACFTSLKAERECHLLARVWRKCVFQIIEDVCFYGLFFSILLLFVQTDKHFLEFSKGKYLLIVIDLVSIVNTSLVLNEYVHSLTSSTTSLERLCPKAINDATWSLI